MPTWLTMTLYVFCLTLVAPLYMWGNSGSWQVAWRVWREYCVYLLVLALPGIVAAIWFWMFGP
jgi:hypothetical protein